MPDSSGAPFAGSWIDLRSDTVTKPNAKMRDAMRNAEVGDDVYGEDPTVNRLEQRAAEIFAKEAAVFVPTGTMGNTIAVKLHTSHGEEIISEARSHMTDMELSMVAWFSGCLARTIQTENGIMSWKQIAAVLRPKTPHNAPTSLISLENTHNMQGGTVYPIETIDEICFEAHARGLKVHMDGARIFNASVHAEFPVARIARDADTVMFCLSKGLGAPVGSMLVGSHAAIEQARLYRKRLGGGMRQVGVLAAAGLVALEDSPARLHEDHLNAVYMADRLAHTTGIRIERARVQTNIIIFDIAALRITSSDFSRELRARGVLANGITPVHMRMVTHADVTREDCGRAADVIAEIAATKTATRVAV